MLTTDTAPDPLKRPTPSRTMWVDAQAHPARSWWLGIRRDDAGRDATIAVVRVDTVDVDVHALDELDLALLSAGYVRADAWQLGGVAGFVAWIEPYGPRLEHLAAQ
jgi:hypothetical protein